MRIVLLTTNEPLYYPYTLAPVLNRWRDHIMLVAFVAHPRGLLRRVFEWISFVGFMNFVRLTMMAVGKRFWQRPGEPPLPSKLCRKLGIPVVKVRRLNASWFLKKLTELDIDLIVSVGCPQIIGKSILSLPSIGVINVHCAPLPKYRGLMPTFWLLLNRENFGAVTVHFVNERIDDGPIILQRRFKIFPRDSLHDVLVMAKKKAAESLLEVLYLCKDKARLPNHPNPKEDATYFSFPGYEEFKKFLSTGRRLI